MKLSKKFISILLVLATLFTAIGVQSVFAGSQIRKGSCRVVIYENEVSACEDEVVYQGHRYLPADYFLWGAFEDSDFSPVEYVTNYGVGSVSYHLSPYGYVSFWGGSRKIRAGNWFDGADMYLAYPAVMYDGRMYVSMEDIANAYNCYYGFDTSVNTMYFYDYY